MLSLRPEELFDEIPSDLGWQPESAPLHDPDLLGLFERGIFLSHLWHGRLHFEYKIDGVGIIGKYQDEE